MKLYVTKTELTRRFEVSAPTVYKYVAGIKKEIEAGRYNRYAIADNLISIAVFSDYMKYHKRLSDKNLRKSVPPFNMTEALAYLDDNEYAVAEKDTKALEQMQRNIKKSLEEALGYLQAVKL